MYRCALNDEFIKSNGKTEPKCVLLRLYGPTHRDTSMQIEIFRKLAEENLGPKLLADFEDGRLEEYLPSNPISWNDMIGDDASAVIARKFALIHKLQIDCLDKGSNWLLNMYQTYFDYFVEVRHNPPISKTCSDSTKQLILELMSKDFSQEIEYLSSLLQKSKEPLVFSHNDLHQNNIILLENLDNRLSLDERIVLIDFEYCSYNHRTFDIANHLSEWCFDYTGDEYPHFTASLDRFPSEEKQRQFVKNYLNELERDIATGKQVVYDDENVLNDKIETILREIQVSMMAANFLWTLWAIKSACTSKITFGYWVSKSSILQIIFIKETPTNYG